MDVNKNACIHVWVEVVNHACLLYQVFVLFRLGSQKPAFIWIQSLVLQAVNSHNRVCHIDWDPVQCWNFLERFISKLIWQKNILVVTEVEKFVVFQPFNNFLLWFASCSKISIALFKVHLEDLRDIWLKVSLKLQWLFNALQAINPFAYSLCLVGFCIEKYLVLLLCVLFETEVS